MFEKKVDMFLISFNQGVKIIKFDRPEKKNSFTSEAYLSLTKILNEDAENDEIVVTIFTGSGDFYCSGTDLLVDNFTSENEDFENAIERKSIIFRDFVTSLINYPKILIAVVNGPAIGVGVTTLALYDIVYASDRATFQTPFLNLALCPEACSSYLLPLTLGQSKANEMLLLGHKMDAEEACKFGLISEVIPHNKLDDFIQSLTKYGSLPLQSLKDTKELIRGHWKDTLHLTNAEETHLLKKCVTSEDFFAVIQKFATRKAKSKL